MAKKTKKPILCDCKGCGKQIDKNEIKRIYGSPSMVYILGYCTAYCYTKDITKGNKHEVKSNT